MILRSHRLEATIYSSPYPQRVSDINQPFFRYFLNKHSHEKEKKRPRFPLKLPQRFPSWCCLDQRTPPPSLPAGSRKAKSLVSLLPLAQCSISIKDTHIGAEGVSPKASFHKRQSQNPQHPPLPSVPESTFGLGCPAGHMYGADGGCLNLLLPAQLSFGNFRCPLFLTRTLNFSSPNLKVGFKILFPPRQEKQAPNRPK